MASTVSQFLNKCRKLKGPLAGIAVIASVSLFAMPTAFAQVATGPLSELPSPEQQAAQQIQQDKASYAAAIVARWQDAAKASDKSDPNYAVDMFTALMKMGPDNLLLAGQASTYEAMLDVVKQGSRAPRALGDFGDDLVFTPVAPCRLVDTRVAGGFMNAGTARTFDVDNTVSFAFQGGNPGPCGVPFNVAAAAAMNFTVTGTTGSGHLTAWGLGTQPLASTLNYVAGDTVANSTVIPVVPGGGNDFSVFVAAGAHVVVDVVGYFAAPVATALNCVQSTLATTVVANLGNINFNANACPAGFTAVSLTCHATLFFGGTEWTGFGLRTTGSNDCQGVNNSGVSQTYNAAFTCCRIPGR